MILSRRLAEKNKDKNYNDEKIFTKEIKISSEEGRYKKTKIILKIIMKIFLIIIMAN